MPETPETTMRPEDVPESLIDLAMTGAKPGCRSDAAFYLANVLPAYEAMVREGHSAVIHAALQRLHQMYAEVARGERPR